MATFDSAYPENERVEDEEVDDDHCGVPVYQGVLWCWSMGFKRGEHTSVESLKPAGLVNHFEKLKILVWMSVITLWVEPF